MDKQIASKDIRNRQLKKNRGLIVLAIAIVSIFFLFRATLKPKVKKSDVRISIAEIGSIEATISARGTVEPSLEVVINSSIDSKIIDVFYRTGEAIKKGDSILLLDKQNILNEYAKLLENMQIKTNDTEKRQLELTRTLSELKTNKEIEELSIKDLESDLKEAKILEEMGGGTKEAIKQAELSLKVAKIKYTQLLKKIRQQESNISIERENIRIEASIADKKLKSLEQQIELADVKADFDGVVTWINEDIGKRVGKEEAIAKLADLSRYKINCNISDSHSEKVRVGGEVIVRVNDNKIKGIINQVSPSLTQGQVNFSVTINDSQNDLLRPNLEVDIYVITSFKDQAIIVKNGGFFNGSKNITAFVIKGDKAKRIKLTTGLNNFEYVEITDGLSEGDEIIISDMTNELVHEEISILE
ncbi:efflux RND transporter periplasmic adaptor subunit [Flavivirga rizhaonensis]|uniref:HlyD family efflux transporter periplasmic adaptor subunit n=1 Tax=Flavivirga rizhaonensis TaxID=2559571 RepID=A0A4S1E269_9FLAO|nr:HlyD family efflux transporter periplasmic adaptor subunit [Flavivirga rizhaonensis]TGV04707.1 HlyD family efflux transporter periplasmic adaptor subunit [Flavivirga rizhaonensis]